MRLLANTRVFFGCLIGVGLLCAGSVIAYWSYLGEYRTVYGPEWESPSGRRVAATAHGGFVRGRKSYGSLVVALNTPGEAKEWTKVCDLERFGIVDVEWVSDDEVRFVTTSIPPAPVRRVVLGEEVSVKCSFFHRE